MKRILIIIAASICLCLSAQAQVFLGGQYTKYRTPSPIDYKYRSIGLCLGFQYHKIAIGTSFDFQKLTPMAHGNYSMGGDFALDLYPFLRYHVYTKDKLSLFLEAGYNYTVHKKEYYHAVSFSPGIQYLLSHRIAVAAKLGLIGYSNSNWYGYKGFSCALGLGASSLSIYIRLGKAKTED